LVLTYGEEVMSAEVMCEHCGKSLFHHSDCYAKAKRYKEMIEFIRKVKTWSCCLCRDDCISCEAEALLRKYGEKNETK